MISTRCAVVLLCVAALPVGAARAQAPTQTPTQTPAQTATPSEPPAPTGITIRPQPGSAAVSGSGTFFEFGVVSPGRPRRGALLVRNLGDEPESADLYGADAVPARGGGFGFTPRTERPVDVGAWIKLDRSRVTLAARATTTVGFTLVVPAAAPSGERIGGVVAEPVEAVSGGGFAVGTRVAVAVYLTVPGSSARPLRPSLTITDLRAPLRGGRACPTLSYTNDGTAVLDPTAHIVVDPTFGSGPRRYPVGKVGGLPPGASIEVDLPCVRNVPPGPSRLTVVLDFPGGTTQRAVRMQHWPFAVLAAGLLLLLLLLALLWLLLAARRRDRDEDSAVPLT